MTNHVPQLRIFISSPGDLTEQRDIAEDVLTELFNRRTYRDIVTAQIIRWDKPQRGTRLRARTTPQKAINDGLPRPRQCELVVVMLWSRLGTPCEVDGKPYRSGTHFELSDALAGSPDTTELLIYQRTETPNFPQDESGDPQRAQWRQLREFIASDHFRDPLTHQPLTVIQHTDAEAFRAQFAEDAEEWLKDWLARHTTGIKPTKPVSLPPADAPPDTPPSRAAVTQTTPIPILTLEDTPWDVELRQKLSQWFSARFPAAYGWVKRNRLLAGVLTAVVLWLMVTAISALVSELIARAIPTPTDLPTSAAITVVYAEADGLIVTVREDSQLGDVQLISARNRSAPAVLGRDFALENGIAPRDTCLVYQHTSTPPALPRACQREGVTVKYHNLNAEPFWFDAGQMLPLIVERQRDGFSATCTPDQGSCPFNLPPQTR